MEAYHVELEERAKRPIVGLTSARTRLTNGQREANDFYRTPPIATRALLEREKFPNAVWEPACGDGAMSKVLKAAGYFIKSTDLHDYGYGEQLDFLQTTKLIGRSIVTNPPFKLADAFALHALSLPGLRKLALFQRLAWLEGMARHDTLWSKHPPTRVWIFSFRVTLWRGDEAQPKDTGGTMALAWYVWDLDAVLRGPPQIGWISEKPKPQEGVNCE